MFGLSFCFQAEDGIPAYDVTGVQTCALPISRSESRRTQAAISAAQRESRGPDREIAGRIRYGPAGLGLNGHRNNRCVGAGL